MDVGHIQAEGGLATIRAQVGEVDLAAVHPPQSPGQGLRCKDAEAGSGLVRSKPFGKMRDVQEHVARAMFGFTIGLRSSRAVATSCAAPTSAT